MQHQICLLFLTGFEGHHNSSPSAPACRYPHPATPAGDCRTWHNWWCRSIMRNARYARLGVLALALLIAAAPVHSASSKNTPVTATTLATGTNGCPINRYSYCSYTAPAANGKPTTTTTCSSCSSCKVNTDYARGQRADRHEHGRARFCTHGDHCQAYGAGMRTLRCPTMLTAPASHADCPCFPRPT